MVQDLSRYATKPIELGDESLAGLRYSGVVYTNALEEWTSALAESFPVRVVNENDRQVIVAR